MNNIALCTICDDSFLKGCQALIYSFLKHNTWFDGDIIVIYNNKYCPLSENSKNELRKICPNIIFRQAEETIYEKFFNNFKDKISSRLIPSGFTFEAFNLDGYSRILYVDADMLVLNDISELFEEGECTFKMCKSGLYADTEPYVRDSQELVHLGLVSINKHALRPGVFDDLIHIGELFDVPHKNFSFGAFEQAVFNLYINNNSNYDVLIIPQSYNKDASRVSVFNPKFEDLKILHFMGDLKPWEADKFKHPSIELWRTYYNEMLEALK